MSNVIVLDDASELESLLRKNAGYVVVVAVTADWCGHCTAFKPEYSLLARRYRDKAVFAMAEYETGVGRKYATGLPTTLVYVGPRTEPVSRVQGNAAKEVQAAIDELWK